MENYLLEQKHLLNMNYAGIRNLTHFTSSKQTAQNMKNIDANYSETKGLAGQRLWIPKLDLFRARFLVRSKSHATNFSVRNTLL